MIPLYIDAVVSGFAMAVGAYVLVGKIGVLSAKNFSPVLEVMIIFVGQLAWALYLLLSITAINKQPSWFFPSDEVWSGNFGYTLARALMLFVWLGFLKLACVSVRRKRFNRLRKRIFNND